MKRQLSAETDEKLVKRIKLEKVTRFKKKGHEKRYHHEEVHVKLSDARVARSLQAWRKWRLSLKKFILEGQKHIKMADRSDNEWAKVEEYVEDELQDNSDNKKRLSPADGRAGRKLKSASQKNGKVF